MLARDAWKNNMAEFIRRFEDLKAEGICRGLYLFGSVFHGDDDELSDLDLMLTLAPNTTFTDVLAIEKKMTEGIIFKIHVNCVPDGFGDDMVEAQRAIKVA